MGNGRTLVGKSTCS
uniref:Uncharacterized protein n=1 Tax=Anguilla anguilla TaxID=7936 RepID=A0A0E9REP0_ANGAN